MIDTDEYTQADDVVDAAPSLAFASLREQARAQMAKAKAARTIDLDIPGVNALVGRFNVLSYDALAKIAKQTTTDKRPRAELYGQCSTLAQACVEIFGRIDGGLVPLADGLEGDDKAPVRFDRRLCEFLGLAPASTSVGCVLALISDVRIPGLYLDYMDWHSGAAADAEGEALGEA